jgi:4a-hydroxytetrahydrobiopterin dehydratase
MSWNEKEGRLVKEFKFDDFNQAMDFINQIHPLAEKQNHHPDILLHSYNRVKVMIYTHDENRITEKDYKLAKEIDKIVE